MALVYFDSSAMVKLVVEEEGSDVAATLWDGCDAAVTSRLTSPEVCAALAAARRHGRLTGNQADEAVRAFAGYWGGIRPLELTGQVARHAGSLAREHALRGVDAVHLASALAVGSNELIVAVWDRRLHAAVRTAGLLPAPQTLPSGS